MSKIKRITVLLIGSVVAAACGGSAVNTATVGNSANAVNTNRTTSPSIEPVRTPPGVDPTPASSPPANAAAIPANTDVSARHDKEKRELSKNKSAKTGVQPNSEIPSADEMQRMLGRRTTIDEVNSPNMMKGTPMMRSKPPAMNSKPANVPTMKSNRKLGGKP